VLIPGLQLTWKDVQTWASFGPPLREQPTSVEQLQAFKERKQKRGSMKEKLLEGCKKHAIDGGDTSVVSAKALEQELDRLATQQIGEAENENKNKDKDKDNAVDKHRSPMPHGYIPDSPADNILDHRSKGGPLLQYLWAPRDNTIQGQTLYLGGDVGSDGNIYCIPGHMSRVLQINTTTDTIQPIGPTLTTSKLNGSKRLYKWLRGIVVGDIIYGLPCHADEILRIDVATQSITKLPIPYDQFYKDTAKAKVERDCLWKYHGGSICPIDNCIYAIPQTAEHVLKFDPATETVSFVGPAFPGRCKWYGGIVGKQDGAIYGVPQNAAGVLRITPHAITTHGNFGSNNHKWHGGAAAANGVIVSVPANADTVLCITPASTLDGEPTLSELGNASTIQSGRHRSDHKYKYLGAIAGTNGKVYLFPCASEFVLQVDTVHGVAKNVGPNLRDAGMETVHQNKWQNGLTCIQDQCVYGMPLSGHTLLRIDCSETTIEEDSPDPIVTTWKLPLPRIECRDKFEGGVITKSGVMYTVPNNHKGVLRIEPFSISSSNGSS